MKNRKAPAADAISAEILKAGGDEMTKFLLMLFNKVWREENSPMKTGMVKNDCNTSPQER